MLSTVNTAPDCSGCLSTPECCLAYLKQALQNPLLHQPFLCGLWKRLADRISKDFAYDTLYEPSVNTDQWQRRASKILMLMSKQKNNNPGASYTQIYLKCGFPMNRRFHGLAAQSCSETISSSWFYRAKFHVYSFVFETSEILISCQNTLQWCNIHTDGNLPLARYCHK